MLPAISAVSNPIRPIVIPIKVPNTPQVDTKEGNCSIQRLFASNSFLFFFRFTYTADITYTAITTNVSMMVKLSNLERRLDELKQENTYITVVANKVASVEELDNKVIGTVLFDINTTNPAVEINNQLINVSALLDAFPSAKIQLEGYADEETGTPEYNQKLSEERTAYVQNLLTTKYNVPNDRIVTISYGSTKKAYTTSLAEQRVVVLRLVF